MGRNTTSQWDFGELFPAETSRKVLSVGELTVQIKRALAERIGTVWVTGEITNFREQGSGHIYFTLKDASAQLSCVLFRGATQVERSLLRDGAKVVLGGDLTVYEPRGQYQLRVTAAEPAGVGALQAAFERLKQKLKAEGLFSQERKRPLPRYPQRIGLVTSPTGAAIRDVLHVIGRRNPALEIVLAPCRVQGEGAALEIANAIRLLNELNAGVGGDAAKRQAGSQLDLILVTRGGGSLEDLWAFNEEVVARAIFNSTLPVVSAVGHEIDFTISDFVADVRAATPSAAAEIVTEGVFSSCQFVEQAARRIRQLFGQRLADKFDELGQCQRRLTRVRPQIRLEEQLQLLDEVAETMHRLVRSFTERRGMELRTLAARLGRVRPAMFLRARHEALNRTAEELREGLHARVRERANRLAMMQNQLRLLGPEQVLARGYSITLDAATGSVLRGSMETAPGKLIKTVLKNGELVSKVEGTNSGRSQN